jgi:DNA-binding MarR family transcriptional regulator
MAMPKTIQQEIKQTRPFPSLEEQVTVNLMRTTRVVEEAWMSYLRREAGISISQYNVLRILRGARPNRLKVSEIHERMINRDPDLTRLLDRMDKQGLVTRERDTGDRRVVLVTITDAGVALLDGLKDSTLINSKNTMSGLSQQKMRELDTLLDQLRDGITR